MIVAVIEIENYKQYAGSHTIDFPQQGMVAVTGPNGAGKTTLFEAIEWCLYGPRTIPLATIPPRDGVGATRVRVTLEDPHDGRCYVVQRDLRNGLTRAEVYTEDQPEQAIVQGPRDVTEYVARQLIGLPHAAFVSTFFTRQKELTFFGEHSPTERRAEVARLLGFQTIREAQEEIGAERTAARRDAESLRAMYLRDSAERDFSNEIEQAETASAAARLTLDACQQMLTAAEAAYANARDELERWRGLQEQDAAQERELLTIAGNTQTAKTRREGAIAELNRLEIRAAERATLAPVAARAEELARGVAAFEAERERARRLAAHREKWETNVRQRDAAAAALQQLVAAHDDAARELAGWFWRDGDDEAPGQAAARLGHAVATVDERGMRERAEQLRGALELAQRAEAGQRKLALYRSQWSKLAAERDDLLVDGEPAARLAMAEATLASVRTAFEEASGELTSARRERRESEELEKIFDERSFGHRCPTCTRPLSDAEATKLHTILRGQTARRRDEEAIWETRVGEIRTQIAAEEAARTAAVELERNVAALRGRLADGERLIGEQETELGRDRDDLEELLAAVGRDSPPEPDDVAAARLLADQAGRVAALAGTIDQLRHRATVAAEGMREAEQAIADLGEVAYDPEAHQAAASELEDARRATTVVAQIDLELGRRPDYETARATAERELADLERQQREAERARAAIGFDAAALRTAREAETGAAQAQRAAREEVDHVRETLRDAEAALRHVVGERDRLQAIAAEADRRGREADELDRMYREFAEFDKFVADHVGPLLAETTERLLSLVTEGKYDRVRFDENYGIEIFDGDECFQLGGFSGGERDVVSLCARLAMSELVGSSAQRPPRFLVLDEVFGSLDSERRAQLLETLGSLASSGHFQQMFIVSHVDDVQDSPAMSEAWTIEERDGVSQVNRPQVLLAAAVP
jgi:exonuclease SbcC